MAFADCKIQRNKDNTDCVDPVQYRTWNGMVSIICRFYVFCTDSSAVVFAVTEIFCAGDNQQWSKRLGGTDFAENIGSRKFKYGYCGPGRSYAGSR